MLMALLLDAANIIGGLLLAIPLLGRFPVIARVTARIAPWRWLIGIIALVAGGYFLIVHLISGPHLFHFEVVGIAVGVILAWERLTGRRPLAPATPVPASTAPGATSHEPATAPTPAPNPADLSGPALLVAVFGIIAIIVGLQGLFTPN
ncbi:hypothetical protein Aph02nite_08590 [Actinoplanes philippinensis]|uniref:Uncharacterized protein n=1 Tax=Actinoplanes philippinensis TaxID=35752 RepID=A0A1I2AI22_9ACTN|nr:hypothetical protein [Actinoplanes philippinensis]GIE74909.1 hypothetical protein Aph02nite_08590 [Actinoplanes philippinensis]SFE42603.1 hypothetical protein SAMN05421541_101680 [Actinoplanes philippinensis]